jgi:hypothetical protein
VALVEVGHHDTLAFGNRTVDAYEFAIFAHAIDLVEGELVLKKPKVRQMLKLKWLDARGVA